MRLKKGVLIVIEGIDGAGKSTQARLLHKKLLSEGYPAVYFREPTKGKWGREVKKLARRADSLSPEEELDLFLKDREENVKKNLRPALSRKKVVILDRYYFSTIAYQGAKGISPARIRKLHQAFAIKPDLVFILDINPAEGLERIRMRKRKDILFEREDYLARARKIFRSFRGRTLIHMNAARLRMELHRDIAARVQPFLHARIRR
ncbi:MAG: dTMP kinase [Clostridiales bacterium]|nr:dTMP kinase [Clostridiales bacterium]